MELTQIYQSGEHQGPEIGILAEIATLQMEYAYLAKLTSKVEYFNRVGRDDYYFR